MSSEAGQTNEERLARLNDLEELRILEKRSEIENILRTSPYFAALDTTFMRKLTGLFLRNAENDEAAVRIFQEIEAHTAVQVQAKQISPQEFAELFYLVQEYLENAEPELTKTLEARIHKIGETKGQILWNDLYEISQNPRRTLEVVREKGVRIELPSEYIDMLRDNRGDVENNPACPILEHIKNQKIFKISGFTNSKASLTIHDLFDHYWTYDHLDKAGIFEKYRAFLDKVGNPQNTDMFNRESELIASTVFGTRLFHVKEDGFVPFFRFDQIQRVLAKSITSSDQPSENQLRVLQALQTIDPESNMAKTFCYTVSNMAIERMEQKRKHGAIKTLSRNAEGSLEPTEVMALLDPEYLALMFDITQMILDPENRANEALLSISVVVEEYLLKLAQSKPGTVHEPLVVRIDDINGKDLVNTTLPPGRVDWLATHAGFASTKSYLC